MKYSFVCILVVFTFHFKVSGQTGIPSSASILGKLVNYTMFSTNGAVSATGTSQIIGNAGANAGSLSGFNDQTLIGTSYLSNSETASRTSDLQDALSTINNITTTATHIPTMGGGEILYPGVYSIAGAGSIAGILTLDAGGDTTAMFIIKLGGALTTGAGAKVVLTGGAASCNVIWSVDGAIAMAASTTMVGTLIANNGAISIGPGGNLDGRLLATLGAVTIDDTHAYKPGCDCTTPPPVVVSTIYYCQNTASVPLDAIGSNLVWGNGNTINPTPSTAILGTTTYYVTQTANGCVGRPAAITVIVFAGPSATISYDDNPFRSDEKTALMTHSGTLGGIYSSSPGLSLDSLTGNVDIEYSLPGNYTVNYIIPASIGGCYLYQISTTLDIFLPPSIKMGSLSDFILFTASGAISNVGVSTIAGNIGTQAGDVSGFESSTVAGTINIGNAKTSTAASDLNDFYNQLNAQVATSTHIGSMGSGETLTPAVYQIAAAAVITANLNFDAQGDPSAVFLIKIGGALTSSASAKVNLLNGACAGNIYWIVDGAISMAANTTLAGNFISHNGAVFMGVGGIINGRLYSTGGAIAVSEFTSTVSKCPSNALWIGTVSNDWHDATNWRHDNIPDSLTNTSIAPALDHYPVVTTGIVAVKNLTLAIGSSLAVNNAEIKINGSLNNHGIIDLTQGTLTLNGNKPQSLKSGAFIKNLIHNLNINNPTGVSLDGALNISGILTMGDNTSFNANGKLNLRSTKTNTATIALIPSSSSITGSVRVERFISGGPVAKFRTYRMLSSPTHNGNNAYSFTEFIDDMYVSGKDGALNHFDENTVNAASAFTYNGGFKPVNRIDTTIAVGTGAYIFFRGNRSGTAGKTYPTFIDPEDVTMDFVGILNQQDVTVILINRGNLVGNPYASSIDWNIGITKTNLVNNIIRIWDPAQRRYATYDGMTDVNGGSNVIPSGQGFFVEANSTGAGSLKFTESTKVNTQPSTLLLSAPISERVRLNNESVTWDNDFKNFTTPHTELRLTLSANSSAFKEETVVVFKEGKSGIFNVSDDASYFSGGTEQNVFLSSRSTDNKDLVINYMPEVSAGSQVKLNINSFNKAGVYQLLVSYKDVPAGYTVKLNDSLLGSSSIVQNGDRRSFTIDKGVANSFGANRFNVSFEAPTTLPVTLTSFTATKVNEGVTINWKSETEINHNRYILERAGEDEKYQSLVTVTAKGSGSPYSFLDKTPLLGNNYYRLVKVSIDEKSITTSPIVINYNGDVDNELISVFPNLVVEQFIVKFNGSLKGAQQTIKITNTTGQVLLTKTVTSSVLKVGYSLNIATYAAGLYIIEIFENGYQKVAQAKFIKQ